MRKAELVAMVSEMAGLDSARADTVVEEIVAQVELALSRGDKVALPGLGSFTVVERQTRQQRHPRSGETIIVPAHNAVRFRPASQLRHAITESTP